jgi:hypothetical protein
MKGAEFVHRAAVTAFVFITFWSLRVYVNVGSGRLPAFCGHCTKLTKLQITNGMAINILVFSLRGQKSGFCNLISGTTVVLFLKYRLQICDPLERKPASGCVF